MILSEGKVESARLLIQHGEDVNAMNKGNQTALHLASTEGCAEIVRLLIQLGADLNTQDKRLGTPLHLALTRVSAKSV
jgi:ankyrin repeat protein